MEHHFKYTDLSSKEEDVVWGQDIEPLLVHLPANALKVWHYSFTEMFNNALDHSEGTAISVLVTLEPERTKVVLRDNGIGIFKKIQRALNLDNESHSILELAKGKLTTDPNRHSGEGIFFTSRVLDRFIIFSGEVFFSHDVRHSEDWILEGDDVGNGTYVDMELSNQSARTTKEVFDMFTASSEDFGFSKTVIPVDLVKYGKGNLVSRSAAKRMLARVDKFKTVVLDFEGVDEVGQGFADEVFRVFANAHPDLTLISINTSEDIERMILWVKAKEA